MKHTLYRNPLSYAVHTHVDNVIDANIKLESRRKVRAIIADMKRQEIHDKRVYEGPVLRRIGWALRYSRIVVRLLGPVS